MPVIYICIGSNVEPREGHIHMATAFVDMRLGKIEKISFFYESKPLGFKSRNKFLNTVLKLNSKFQPMGLLSELKGIEQLMGRRKAKIGYEDRIIDLDILFYGSRVMKTRKLTIPHPRLHERKFVLVPMAEMDSGFVHPVLKKTIGRLLEQCSDKSRIIKKHFTAIVY